MASRDIPARVQLMQDKKKERNIARYNNNIREVKQTFLIVCEGTNTEPDYFNEFKLGSAQIETAGTGYNTLSLINKAIQIRKEYLKKEKIFDQNWVVFDKDDFSANDFNAAIVTAEANDFKVAYSNQSFEYWFLLHFNLYQGEVDRNTYAAKLSALLGFPYTKDSGVSARMFNALFSFQQTAIGNAIHVYNSFGPLHASPAIEESSTKVHELVQELNRYL